MDLRYLAEKVVEQCEVNAYCTKVGIGKKPTGSRPGVFQEAHFMEIKPGKYGYTYLLVFVETFSGWVEAFLTKQETITVVTKKKSSQGLECLR